VDPLAHMDRDGYAILRGAYPPALIATLHDAYVEMTHARRDLGMPVGESRLMLPVPIAPPFCDQPVIANAQVLPLLEALLSSELVVASYGSVVALPGAPAQHVHKDHEFLFPLPLGAELPCHAVTLVVPLVRLDESTGTTALYPGSHRTAGSQGIELERPWLERGDCFLMDYRLSHGGTPNPGKVARPLLYIVYARPWFVDTVNFRDVPPLALAPASLLALPDRVRALFRRAAITGH
jgi:ectoine hydroxylase-related dioxygenase (phytanoyl-CoA dioxygenase family)